MSTDPVASKKLLISGSVQLVVVDEYFVVVTRGVELWQLASECVVVFVHALKSMRKTHAHACVDRWKNDCLRSR